MALMGPYVHLGPLGCAHLCLLDKTALPTALTVACKHNFSVYSDSYGLGSCTPPAHAHASDL